MNRSSLGTPWRALVGVSALAVMLGSGVSLTFAGEPPVSSPMVQDDKAKSGDTGKIQERAVKRPAPKPRPPLSPPSTPSTPPDMPVPHPN